MNISAAKIMFEYDNKSNSYGRCNSGIATKPDEKYSFFSDPQELNSLPKDVSGVTKVGDQTSIVDFFGFYNEDEDAEF